MTGVIVAFIGLAIVVPAVVYALTYNSIVDLRNQIATSWAGIDVELTRRHDLVPRLVNAVEGAATHEQQLLTELASRNAAAEQGPHTVEAANALEPPVASGVAQVLALREKYPELNSQRNYLDLQQQLAATENRIAAARRYYNHRVQRYNNRVAGFPGALIAGRHGFDVAEHLDL